MATIIEMPKLSDTMSEGKILSWMKKEGEQVKAGDVLAEIESDKANMEMEAYDTGYVRKLLVPLGGSAQVGAPIAIVTESPDEDITELLRQTKGMKEVVHAEKKSPQEEPLSREPREGASTAEERQAEPRQKSPALEFSEPVSPAQRAGQKVVAQRDKDRPAATATSVGYPPREGKRKVIASPLAFRMAAELGVDLLDMEGSGPDGRIVKRDVEKAVKEGSVEKKRGALAIPAAVSRPSRPFEPASLEASPDEGFEDVTLSSMRRVIGARLGESMRTAPHYYVTVEIDMKPAMRARDDLNKLEGVAITYNDMVVKASAMALLRHPRLNASLQGEFLRLYKSVDIGVAVALPDGLITPVIRACHLKSLGRISLEIKELAEKARQKKLTPDEYQGGTFTVSNLGMLGVKHFTAIINPPQASILAVSAIEEVPVVEGGAVVTGHRMCVTLSSDHRVVDGAQAALFLKDFKRLMETPMSFAL